ncbi:hypothetical protein AYJ57_18070 [Salipiger sp. CCB-MM3]|nr:hypothetical protein AYJ57_18070 [Salipiger sp. CCB-MM3]
MSDAGGSSYQSGIARDHSADRANGSINARSGGGYTFTLSRDGTVCTGVFDEAAAAKATELAVMNCSGGARGSATIVYDSEAKPDRVVYAVNGEGGGTIEF